jgi:hypothetical protein
MPRGRDEAGNIWELDAQGNPLRMIQPAQVSTPGALGVVPPNPAIMAAKQAEQARQAAAERRAEEANIRADRSDTRAAAAEARAQKKFESEDTMAPPPGDVSKTGEEYLATIPPSLAGQVKAMAEGRRAFPTGSALRSPAVQQLIAAATQYDPTLDAANAATRVATRKKFTSGTTRDNITAINTALGHLGTLWQDAQKLNNFSSPMVNAPVNAFEQHALGDPRYSNFALTRHAVVDELEKAFRGSGGTQTGIDEWKNGISSSQSPEQLRGAIGKAVQLLDSRLQALGDAYSQGMGRSSDPMTFLNPHAQAVFNALGPNGDGNVPDLPKDFGGAPPILGGGDTPPPAPPPSAGPPSVSPVLPGGIPRADYSSMVGGPDQALATQAYRRAYDPVGAAALSSFIRKGAPYDTAAAYAQSHGFEPPPPDAYAAAVAFQKGHPGSSPNVEADRFIPTTFGERLAASPAAAVVAGAGSGATAGIDDAIGRTIAGPAWDANRQALAATNPGSDMAGNVIGGVAGSLAAPELAAKYFPGAMGLASRVGAKLGRFAPAAGDAAYGAVYGANEDPNDPLMGAAMGGLTGAGAGYAGRKLTNGLAGVIAPPEGAFGPAYQQGVFPTVGQRFGKSGFAGRMVNTAEQAMQSMPGLGAMVARARDIPRDAAQLGGFNRSLSELKPFDQLVGNTISELPPGMQPGTEPHAFTQKAFGKAYDIARQGMQFVPDQAYIADHSAFNQTLHSGVLSAPQADQVQRVISTSVGSRLPAGGGVMTGDAYQKAGSELDKAIGQWGKDGTTQPMAAALSDYKTIFDQAARRNSDPAAVNLLDAADRGYAKYAVVRNASARVGGDPGTFTMKNLSRAAQQEGGGVKSGPFLRGQANMQDYASAIQPLGDTLSNSGTGERLLTNRLFLGEQAGSGAMFGHSLLGGVMAHPGALAPFLPYAPGFNKMFTRAIAPRQYTLPPALADPINLFGSKIDDLAPFIGKAAVPGSLAYMGYNQ